MTIDPSNIPPSELEFVLLAIERYRKVTTVVDFEDARRFAMGVHVGLLRVRPDLDHELWQAYQDACNGLGLAPENPESVHESPE